MYMPSTVALKIPSSSVNASPAILFCFSARQVSSGRNFMNLSSTAVSAKHIPLVSHKSEFLHRAETDCRNFEIFGICVNGSIGRERHGGQGD
jgi:hypothetical protein